MSFFRRAFFYLAFFVAQLPAAEFADFLRERLEAAHVSFDVTATASALELVGCENGSTVFRASVPKNQLSTARSTFDDFSQGPFCITKEAAGVHWAYASESSGETFELLVKPSGDMTLLNDIENYAGHDSKKRYAFKTLGTIENYGNLAFYDIVTVAQQFHNYGTLQSYGGTLSQNYLFNSGFMQFGKIPDEAVELRNPMVQSLLQKVKPVYKHYTVENYGTFISLCQFQIKGGLNYLEHGTSDFAGLQMFGGSIRVEKNNEPKPAPALPSSRSVPPSSSPSSSSCSLPGSLSSDPSSLLLSFLDSLPAKMNVREALNGTIHDFSVSDDSSFMGRDLSFAPIRNFHLGYNATFHSPNPFKLDVRGDYKNDGVLSSSEELSLSVSDNTDDLGLIIAKKKLDLLFKRQNNLQNRIISAVEAEKNYSGKFFTAKCVTHTDHYLNTITDWYDVIQDQFGHEISRSFSHRTETGYVFQKRETKVEEFREGVPAEIVQALQQQDAGLQSLHNEIEELAMQMNSLQKDITQQMKEYNRDLMRALLKSGGKLSDIQRIKRDPLVKAIGSGDGAREEWARVLHDYPQVDGFDDCFRQSQLVHDYVSPFTRALNHPAMRFVNEVVIPMAIIAALMTGDVFSGGTLTPATAPALAACALRLAPVIGRAAVALGASEAYQAAYTGVRVLFNKAGRSGSRTKKGDTEPSTSRVQSTSQDADKYIKGLTDKKGVLSKKMQTKDGYDYYEFEKKCEYNGIQFKKGDYISRDTLHNEWEWFRGAKDHRGPINSKTGKVNTDKAVRSRVLQVK